MKPLLVILPAVLALQPLCAQQKPDVSWETAVEQVWKTLEPRIQSIPAEERAKIKNEVLSRPGGGFEEEENTGKAYAMFSALLLPNLISNKPAQPQISVSTKEWEDRRHASIQRCLKLFPDLLDPQSFHSVEFDKVRAELVGRGSPILDQPESVESIAVISAINVQPKLANTRRPETRSEAPDDREIRRLEKKLHDAEAEAAMNRGKAQQADWEAARERSSR